MKSTDFPANLATGFRPAKHCRWIMRAAEFLNAPDLAWHNRLRLETHDLEILKTVPKDSGLILAANHSDEIDLKIFIELSRRSHRRFTYMVNSEAFEEWHGLYGWLLQRLGDFSVERGGSDPAARRYAVDVVKTGHDVLVMFPEGEISYLNDQVQPFKTGIVHMGLQAITETLETRPAWTACILPIAIQYRYRKPIGSILEKRIRAMEKRLSIRASFSTLQGKIIHIMATILKCQELISSTRTTSQKLARLREQAGMTQAALISKVESKYRQIKIDPESNPADRAQKIIFLLREQLRQKKLSGREAKAQLENSIKDLKKSIQMSGWQPQYIDLNPSEERLAETVKKLEREVFNLKTPRPLGNRNVFVRIGRPMDLSRYVEPYQKDPSTLSRQIAEELRHNIQLLIEEIPAK